MAIDTSIYSQIQPPQNPLTTVGQVASVNNALANNRLLQNENALFQARSQAGQLAAQAIDPQTGQFDPVRFNKLVAGSNLGPATMEAIQGGNTAATGQNQVGITGQILSQERVKSITSHQGLLSSILAPLTTPDANPSKDDVYKAASKLVSNPDLDPDTKKQLLGQTAQWLSDLPDDPTQIKARLKGLQLSVQDASARMAAITGQAGLTNTGGKLVPTVTNNYTGSVTQGQGQPIDTTLSPSDASQPVQITNPDGSTSYITKGEFLAMRQGATGAPGPDGQVGGGGSSAPQPSSAPTSAASASAPHVPQNVGASLGLAQSQALGVRGAANENQAQGLQTYANDYQTHKGVLTNLRANLENFTPGPQAHMTKQLGQLASAFGIASPQSAEGTAAQEEYSKLAWQIAHAQNAQLGGHGTDSQTQAALNASPSEFLTKVGNKNVLAVLMGNEDAIAAKNLAWQRWTAQPGHGGETYGQFNAQFNPHFNPVAFQWSYMSPSQQQTIEKDLKAHGQWGSFQHQLKVAGTLQGQLEAQ